MTTYTTQQDIGLFLFEGLVYSAYATLALWYSFKGGRQWFNNIKLHF